MNKIIVNLAIVSCVVLGATLARASNEGGTSTPAQVNYYEPYDEHGKKQAVLGSEVEGVVHPSEPMKKEDLKFKYRDSHRSTDGA
ncbi:MAG: hypothetical protein DID90_2727553801 [Candidatus Nitrotoga sp. LAW]|nr:MAG: hypothetical protein DID90_2727553801 [Candidatus Nitrotoga sp. LAW]